MLTVSRLSVTPVRALALQHPERIELESPLPGVFNVENVLAAVAVVSDLLNLARSLGFEISPAPDGETVQLRLDLQSE